jgi:glycosyltransferase involved in cell wall biosynthesis
MTLHILMPFYGRIDHFRVAVESVLVQEDLDWRLTIVDDQYPDPAAGEWALAQADPRVSYVRNEKNLGVSGNFQHCVELMTGDFAVIIGCDDKMLPGFVGRVRELITRFPDATLIQPGVQVIDQDGRRVVPLADRVKAIYRPGGVKPRVLAGRELATSLARGNWAYFPSLVWRVSEIQAIGFRSDLEVALDLDLLLTIAGRNGSLVVDDDVVFEYRRHGGSVSAFTATDGTRFVEEADVLRGAASTFDRLGWHAAARVARRHLSSRFNALSVLPRAIRSASPAQRSVVVRHILGRPQRAEVTGAEQ